MLSLAVKFPLADAMYVAFSTVVSTRVSALITPRASGRRPLSVPEKAFTALVRDVTAVLSSEIVVRRVGASRGVWGKAVVRERERRERMGKERCIFWVDLVGWSYCVEVGGLWLSDQLVVTGRDFLIQIYCCCYSQCTISFT